MEEQSIPYTTIEKRKQNEKISIRSNRNPELERLFQRSKGRHKYDCLVPFSGGKDSTYAAYLLKRKYGLEILAVTMDIHLLSPQTRENMQKVTKELDIDHIIVRHKWSLCRTLFSAFIRKSGMSPRAICWVCNMLEQKTIFETLQKYDISYLVAGNSEDQLATFRKWEKALGFHETGEVSFDYWYNWYHAYKKLLRKVLPTSEFDLINEALYPEPHLGDPALRVIQIPLFRYEPYDVGNVVNNIRKVLGWKIPTDVGGTENDCIGLQFAVYLYRKQYGDAEYVKRVEEIVASGMATEEIAERAINNRDYSVRDFFYKELNLSDKDFHPEQCDPYLRKWLGFLKPIR